ncbi:MAG: hypothetical protein WC736_15955 [Gallionella sp.]|jgi:hypothetical protein
MQDLISLKRRLSAQRETAIRKISGLQERIDKIDAALNVLSQIDLGEEFTRGSKTTAVLDAARELGVFPVSSLVKLVVERHPKWRGAERNVRNIFEKQFKMGRFVLVAKGGSPRYPSTYKISDDFADGNPESARWLSPPPEAP